MAIEIEQLREIYQKTIISIKNQRELPGLSIEYYPYVGINNRIRLRDDVILVRISDVLRDAPLEIHQALAEILLRKLYRKRIPSEVSETFNSFLKKTEVREKSIETRRTRGRKVLTGAQGTHFDLASIFELLNEKYFQNSIPKPILTWSAKDTSRILGHYDSVHHTISISKSLDDARVPSLVVEYVVYHEMLHIKHPTRYENGRRYSHTPAFRRDEKEFAFFAAVEEWIEKYWWKLSTDKRKKKPAKGFFRQLLDF